MFSTKDHERCRRPCRVCAAWRSTSSQAHQQAHQRHAVGSQIYSFELHRSGLAVVLVPSESRPRHRERELDCAASEGYIKALVVVGTNFTCSNFTNRPQLQVVGPVGEPRGNLKLIGLVLDSYETLPYIGVCRMQGASGSSGAASLPQVRSGQVYYSAEV